MKSPKTLQEAIQHFSDENVCIDAVANMRWENGIPECPKCFAKEHYWLATQKRWKCKKCGKQFSVKVGTIFEDSAIPLTKWMLALWMLANCRNGVSSYEIHRAIGVTQKSAWFMLHRLRLALRTFHIGKLGGDGGEVESDETWVGGNPRKMHKERRIRQRIGGTQSKTIVMGLLDRNRQKVRAHVIPAVTKEAMAPVLLKDVSQYARLYTDAASVYENIEKPFVHEMVNKLEGYVRGRVHVNGIENFWSLLKRGLHGTYIAVEPFHLFRYVDEQCFRFNNRLHDDKTPKTDYERFEAALSQVKDRRLTFAEVTGKTGSEARA